FLALRRLLRALHAPFRHHLGDADRPPQRAHGSTIPHPRNWQRLLIFKGTPMDYAITKRSSCSVCGIDTFRRTGWFLVVENRWLDRLKILSWHSALASQKDMKSVCCRQHLRTLIAHWLTRASLHLPPAHHPPLPIGSDPRLVRFRRSPRMHPRRSHHHRRRKQSPLTGVPTLRPSTRILTGTSSPIKRWQSVALPALLPQSPLFLHRSVLLAAWAGTQT